MRIGIDARLYQETGVGRYISNLIDKLYQIDKENQYFVFTRSDSLSKIPFSNNWRVVRVDTRWHTLAEQVLLPLVLTKYNLDLIHFPYFSVPFFYPGKFVVTIHDITNLNYATGKASTLPYPIYKLKHFGYKLILKTALSRAEKIIVPSYAVGNEIIKVYPRAKEKLVVTYEGGMEKINYAQKKLDFEPFFFYVGNVYPHKNLERGILAIKKLNLKRTSQIKLVIAGKEDFFLKRLKVYARDNQAEKNIVFLGKVSDNTLSNLYNRALGLFFPSLSEGFGLPALEAMQHGCIVCCSDIPIFHEVCQNVPLYFNPENIDDMVEVLERILSLSSQEKKILVTLGKESVKNFSWENMAKQTLAIYKEVLK